jgi:anti-sigma regulatory factor (Ser/Thr protein kinase)
VVQTPSPPLLHRFAPHVAELPVARRALRDWLNRVPRDLEVIQELLIVATELCTNAVRHAGTGLVTMRAWEDGEAVVIEVESVDNATEKSPIVRNLDDPLAESGRGMVIVNTLCNDVSIVMRGRTRYVRCRKFVPYRYEPANA